MNLIDPEFDWVTARHQCSLRFEFEKLKRDLERSTKTRQELAPANRPADVGYTEDGDLCTLLRGPLPHAIGKTFEVTFAFKGDHILVKSNFGKEPSKLTITLNDDGKCRFRINGNGEYQRWQVIRRFLEALFFGSTPLTDY